MEHLQFAFELEEKSVHDEDEEKDNPFFTLSGYASTFKNTDLVDDVIEPGAFSKSLAAKNGKKIKILWQHNHTQPIGRVTKIFEDEKGLFIKAILPKDHSQASDVAVLIKSGIIDSMSIGFTVSDEDRMKNGKRKLKEIKVHEISLVTLPANPKARVTDFKMDSGWSTLPLAPRNTIWDHKEALNRIDEFAYTYTDSPEIFYKKACFINGSETETLFKDIVDEDLFSNKSQTEFLFADIVDGELKAVPEAIFFLAAKIKCMLLRKTQKTELDNKLTEIKLYIVKYYEKMDLANPFATDKFNSEEFECLHKRDLEHILRESGLRLSKSAATHLVSCLDLHRSDSEVSQKQQDIDNLYQSILQTTQEISTNGY